VTGVQTCALPIWAAEVHMRIASPPTMHSCFYGVNTPKREKLLAALKSVDQMCEYIQADSLSFISIGGLYRAVGENMRNDAKPQYCDACFTGDYPTHLTDQEDQRASDQLSLLNEKTPVKETPILAEQAGLSIVHR